MIISVISEFEPHVRKFSDNVGIGSRPTAADKKRRVEIIFFEKFRHRQDVFRPPIHVYHKTDFSFFARAFVYRRIGFFFFLHRIKPARKRPDDDNRKHKNNRNV